MLVFLYRWRLKPGLEDQFVESWSAITRYYRDNAGSLGSRLHKGNDGIWYAYAQWHSPGDREQAFDQIPDHPARERLQEAIDEFLGETVLDIRSDLLAALPITDEN
ncbi:MAG: antibiotic biosynthesis monooxygenase [Pyrinomonadaceae bacterium]